jgi:FMN reductase
MKAHIVPTYVFIEEKDFHRNEIVNDDILFRIDRLVEDTVMHLNVLTAIQEAKDAAYDF